MTTRYAPCVNLVIMTTTRTSPVRQAPNALMARAVLILRRSAARRRIFQFGVPVPHHAGLADRERGEDTHDVELDQPGHGPVEGVDQSTGDDGEQDDAVGVGQSVTAILQLPGQVTVLGENRRQQRKAVVGGVGGEDEDQRCGRLDVEEHDCVVAEHGGRQLGDDGPLRLGCAVAGEADEVAGVLHDASLGDQGKRGHAGEHGDGQQPHRGHGASRVERLGLTEGRHSVGNGLDTGQRGAARGERPKDKQGQRQRGEADLLGSDPVVGALGHWGMADQRTHQADARPSGRRRRRTRRSGQRTRVRTRGRLAGSSR